MQRGILTIAALLFAWPSAVHAAEPLTFTTKSLLAACDQYLAAGAGGVGPAVLCVTWFDGWTAAFTLSAGGKIDREPVFGGICPPDRYSANDLIRKFVGLVHQYPAQFDAPIFNDPMYGVPYALKQMWPCTK